MQGVLAKTVKVLQPRCKAYCHEYTHGDNCAGAAAAMQEATAAARLLLPADHAAGSGATKWAAALSAAIKPEVRVWNAALEAYYL